MSRPASAVKADVEAPPLAARAAGLRYVSDRDPGIRRLGAGKTFRYLAPDGARVRDPEILARIRKLAIPPAYVEVWICVNPRGHLQATGIDARGRKQYRYHLEWRTARDGAKFARMIEFGEALPRLRARLRRDLALPGLPREKVLAVVVALLDATLLRVGNEEYARSNKSYGLTTLRDRHVQFVRDGRARFRFRGKGGLEREVVVDDRRLSRIVRRCRELPGQALFQYLGDDGELRGVDSGQVNDYLAEILGAGFTAKDFRTWAGTLSAMAKLCGLAPPQPPSERAFASSIAEAAKEVAAELGNTPAVCRKSYINPIVFDAWRAGGLRGFFPEAPKRARRQMERCALAFLRAQARARR